MPDYRDVTISCTVDAEVFDSMNAAWEALFDAVSDAGGEDVKIEGLNG